MWSRPPSTPGAETVVTENSVQPRTSHVGMVPSVAQVNN
jgi:hypothetical protein